ncbi:hypothetical protein BJ742DRAFT_846785 [Cladochytrium replicatum]|nr:hypothetical protein BJ742DRAFT_846785 [Cladochytrium replicatum]
MFAAPGVIYSTFSANFRNSYQPSPEPSDSSTSSSSNPNNVIFHNHMLCEACHIERRKLDSLDDAYHMHCRASMILENEIHGLRTQLEGRQGELEKSVEKDEKPKGLESRSVGRRSLDGLLERYTFVSKDALASCTSDESSATNLYTTIMESMRVGRDLMEERIRWGVRTLSVVTGQLGSANESVNAEFRAILVNQMQKNIHAIVADTMRSFFSEHKPKWVRPDRWSQLKSRLQTIEMNSDVERFTPIFFDLGLWSCLADERIEIGSFDDDQNNSTRKFLIPGLYKIHAADGTVETVVNCIALEHRIPIA